MAEFLRLTIKGPDNSTAFDTVVNSAHIGAITPCLADPSCSWISTRGGLNSMKPLKVVGTPPELAEALAQDCRVAILSLNDKGNG